MLPPLYNNSHERHRLLISAHKHLSGKNNGGIRRKPPYLLGYFLVAKGQDSPLHAEPKQQQQQQHPLDVDKAFSCPSLTSTVVASSSGNTWHGNSGHGRKGTTVCLPVESTRSMPVKLGDEQSYQTSTSPLHYEYCCFRRSWGCRVRSFLQPCSRGKGAYLRAEAPQVARPRGWLLRARLTVLSDGCVAQIPHTKDPQNLFRVWRENPRHMMIKGKQPGLGSSYNVYQLCQMNERQHLQ